MEHCMTQPHVECVGEWNVSGTYPDCVCGFVCKINESQTNDTSGSQNASNNETGNQSANDTNQTPSDEPTGVFPEPTDRSISEMMDDGLDTLSYNFYRTHSGTFTEKTYKWERTTPIGDEFMTAPASDIKFDNTVINSIEASGFVVFESSDGRIKEADGVAIFRAKQTMLDNYTGADTYDIEYFPSLIEYDLEDCWTLNKDYNVDMEGDWLITYKFACEDAQEK